MTGPGPLPAIEYSPGSWVGVAGDQIWLLADVHPGEPVVSRCWEVIRQGAEVDDVLSTLRSAGSRSVASFAVVRYADAAAHVFVRGVARVELVTVTGEPVTVRTPGLGYSFEQEVDQKLAELRLLGPAGPEATGAAVLPLAGGVVLASHLGVWPAGPPAESAPSVPASRPLVPEAPPAAEAVPEVPPAAAAVPAAAPAPAPEVPPVPTPVERRPPEEPEDVGPAFDHLFGATQLPTTDPDEEFFTERPETRNAERPATREFSATTLPPAVTEPPRIDVQNDDGLIVDVSWAMSSGTPSAPQQPAAPLAEGLSEDLEITTYRTPRPRRTPSGAGAGPTVTAVRCSAGHLNPTEAETCRVCGATVPVQNPTVVPRPTLGVLRLSTGDLIQLDRGVILGRAREVPAGPDRPNFVHLSSPDNEISRRHVEVRLDGWQVVVVDLNSRNGTVVTLPNRAPEQLPSGGSRVLEPGSVVSLTDTVSFRFEVTG